MLINKCGVCGSTDVERAMMELELFECEGCGNFLSGKEIETINIKDEAKGIVYEVSS